MRNLADCELEIEILKDKLADLEEELSRKEEFHLREFTAMRAYLYCVMQKYLIK